MKFPIEELIEIRKEIHTHPELGHEEWKTSSLISEFLESQGCIVHHGITRTGVIGVLRAGSSKKMIGLRADMDALPIQEKNCFSHQSRHQNKMHACGHDGHCTMLLGAAAELAKNPGFDGTVVFIFQPAEEGRGGAAAMVKEGLFEQFPVDAIFGMHNWPGIESGSFAVHAGPVMASIDRFEIKVRGVGCHAALAYQGIDPIIVATNLITQFQTIVTRSIDALEPAVISVTQFHAGDAFNVIPDDATLCGTVRTFDAQTRELIQKKMKAICDAMASCSGATIEFEYSADSPATINHPDMADLCAQAAQQVVGKDKVKLDMKPSMAAEDFAHMLQVKPGCYVWIGNGPSENGKALHHPTYDFNDTIIPMGVDYWVNLVKLFLPVK